MINEYKVNRIGELESGRSFGVRYTVYAQIKKIDIVRDIVFLEDVRLLGDMDGLNMLLESYIYYTDTMKKIDLKVGDSVSFRATVMHYNIFYTDWNAPTKKRLVNVRNVKKI